MLKKNQESSLEKEPIHIHGLGYCQNIHKAFDAFLFIIFNSLLTQFNCKYLPESLIIANSARLSPALYQCFPILQLVKDMLEIRSTYMQSQVINLHIRSADLTLIRTQTL